MAVYIFAIGSGVVHNGIVTSMPAPGGQLQNYYGIRNQEFGSGTFNPYSGTTGGAFHHINDMYKSGGLTGWERPGSSFA